MSLFRRYRREFLQGLKGKLLLAAAAGVGLWLLSGLFLVEQNEGGAVFFLGRLQTPARGPGLHYHLPWPLSRAETVNTKKVRTLVVGGTPPESYGRSAEDLLYRMTNYDSGKPLISFLDSQTVSSQFYTGDLNILEILININYTVLRPGTYLTAHRRPEALLREAAEAVASREISSRRVEELLLREPGLEAALLSRIRKAMEPYQTGIRIVSVQFQTVSPPQGSVNEAFLAVKDAENEKNRRIEEARRQAAQTESQAQGEAQTIIDGGKVTADGVKNLARKAVAVYRELAARKKSAGDGTLPDRLYWQALEEILGRGRTILVEDGRPLEILTFTE